MLEVPVLDSKGTELDKMKLDEAALGGKVNVPLLREVVRMHEARKRVGTACTKTRSEVIGTGRKPYRQKGTGYARAGSFKSPLWRGGGTVFGPRPRDYGFSVPKKARRLAVKSALLSKFLDGEVVVLDAIDIPEPKTKLVASMLRALGIEGSCLIVSEQHDEKLWRAARNIPRLSVIPLSDLNAYDILKVRKVVLARSSVQKLVDSEQK